MSAPPRLGLAAGASAAPLVYAVVRVVQMRLQPDPDPGAVVWSEHSAMLTRLMVSGYVAAAVCVGMLAIARARPAWMHRAVAALGTLSALAIVAQSWWAP